MSSELLIRAHKLGKQYHIYEKPKDRLLQTLMLGRRKYYKDFWALQDINFEINRGETVGIIGRNGSGKSTLLQLLCATLHPTTGSVEVKGRVAALLELGAGFNPVFTGRENVYLNGVILGLTNAEIDARFDDIAAFADIGAFIDQPVKTYSSGMYVRLAFAVAIQVDPNILIIDEALAVGDAQFQAKCLNRIRSMQRQGVSILFVSHDMTSVRKLCDRTLWLEGGRMRAMGEVATITAGYLEQIFATDDSNPLLSEASIKAQKVEEIVRPIAHWGSNIGTVISVRLQDEVGCKKVNLKHSESFIIAISIRIPDILKTEHLHAAFSIKNLDGMDLICRSTFDDTNLSFAGLDGEREVQFHMTNILNSGKYMLTVAIEDRSTAAIQYYEYIEGVLFFNSTCDQLLYGVIAPEIRMSMTQSVSSTV
jgi:lipopolysaccharide transport system ATP-binding protein